MAAEDDLIVVSVNGQIVRFSADSSVKSTAITEDGIEVKRTTSYLPTRDGSAELGPAIITFAFKDRAGLNVDFSLPINDTSSRQHGAGWGADLFVQTEAFVVDESGARTISQDAEVIIGSAWTGLAKKDLVIALKSPDSRLSATLSDQALIFTPTDTLKEYQFELVQVPRTSSALALYGLEELIFVDLWDWFRWFCLLIWALMELVFSLAESWGATILVLAVLVKIVTYPITQYAIHYQDLAAEQQARIAPLLAEAKSKYTGVEQSKKIVEIYDLQHYQHGAPFKSLLGIAIQIPVLVALFNILGNVSELNGIGFLWINDLTMADRLMATNLPIPYFGSYVNLLPIALGIVTLLSAIYTRDGWDRSRLTNGLVMGGLFFALFYSFPSALVLYWLAANLLQLAQQLLIGSGGINSSR